MTTKQPPEWEKEFESKYLGVFREADTTYNTTINFMRYLKMIKRISQIETAAVQRGVKMALEALVEPVDNERFTNWNHGFNTGLTQSRENITNLLTKIS